MMSEVFRLRNGL